MTCSVFSLSFPLSLLLTGLWDIEYMSVVFFVFLLMDVVL